MLNVKLVEVIRLTSYVRRVISTFDPIRLALGIGAMRTDFVEDESRDRDGGVNSLQRSRHAQRWCAAYRKWSLILPRGSGLARGSFNVRRRGELSYGDIRNRDFTGLGDRASQCRERSLRIATRQRRTPDGEELNRERPDEKGLPVSWLRDDAETLAARCGDGEQPWSVGKRELLCSARRNGRDPMRPKLCPCGNTSTRPMVLGDDPIAT